MRKNHRKGPSQENQFQVVSQNVKKVSGVSHFEPIPEFSHKIKKDKLLPMFWDPRDHEADCGKNCFQNLVDFLIFFKISKMSIF